MKHTFEEAKDIFSCPFFKLLRIAHEIHVQNFDEQSVQISDILSVKTGGCSEDTVPIVPSPPETQPMLDLKTVLEAARKAKECGAVVLHEHIRPMSCIRG